ncbi:hypothetical protein JCM3766R1_004187 [Sporobolomyces carnicolor]
MQRSPLLQSTNSLGHAANPSGELCDPPFHSSRPRNLELLRPKPKSSVEGPVRHAAAASRAGDARSSHLPTPPHSRSAADQYKRPRSRSYEGQDGSRKQSRHPPSPAPSSAKPRRKAAPPPPPPLVSTRIEPDFRDFLLCARFRTPLISPSPHFVPPSPTHHHEVIQSPLHRPVASTSRVPYGRPSTGVDQTIVVLSSSLSPAPSPAAPASRTRIRQQKQVELDDFSPDRWEFLRGPTKDRIHLSEDEFFDSDHDDWADAADPHYHDIKDLHERSETGQRVAGDEDAFWDREFEPWGWIEERIKFKLNRGNNMLGEQGMLPDAWSLGAMRIAEERERREKERRSARQKDSDVGQAAAGARQAKESISKLASGKQNKSDARPHGATNDRDKLPFLARLQTYYDIDEPFTDDSDIENELQKEAAVGLAAVAIPLIRKERDRRKARRRAGKAEDSSNDEEEE